MVVGHLHTSSRRGVRVAAARAINQVPKEPIEGNIELDSHADTCVFGQNFVVLEYTGKECDVTPYTSSYKAIPSVPIVTAATAWTDPDTAATYILVVNEGLWMPDKMEHSLLNPNQLRAWGCCVQDDAWSGAPLYIEDPTETVVIPLTMTGVTIGTTTRTPSEQELANCQHIALTSPHVWDPTNVITPQPRMSVAEHRLTRGIASTQRSQPEDVDPTEPEVYDLDAFNKRLIGSCRVTSAQISAVMPTDVPTPPTFISGDRHSDVTPQSLAERWFIGVDTAKKTLKSTTQRLVRSALMPLSRRYRSDRMFRLPRLEGEWFTDTVMSKVKSRDGNICGQIFANDKYFAVFYPMDSKAKAGDALKTFCKEYGVPELLRSDQAKEMVKKNTEFQAQVRKNQIRHHAAEAGMHNQSPAEGVVREVRRRWYRVMFAKKVPSVLWDYGVRWVCETMSRTHLMSHRVDGGGVPLQSIVGETVDISEYLDFGFYDWVWYRENGGMDREQKLARWLGVSHHVGSVMCFWVLQANGEITARSTVWRVTNLEQQTDEVKQRISEFNQMVKDRLHGEDFPMDGAKPDPDQWADLMEDDADFRDEFFKIYGDDRIAEADDQSKGTDEYSPEVLDSMFLNMELALPRGDDGPTFARVKKRLKDADGKPVGVAHKNPVLDTRMFEVEFADGTTASMAANAIAENLFAQIDAEGNRFVLIDEIIGHRTTGDEVKQADAFVETKSGRRRRITTKGWEILVRWKDGSETWVPLKDMKESYPVQLAEYAVQARVHEEPAFAWWVRDVLRKRERIVAKVKSKYWLRTHKYGIQIPKSVDEALAIDRENGNELWAEAIAKEMANVKIAFEECDKDGPPPGYKKIDCHMIFDIKLSENYRRKARFVAGGHKVEAPTSITYSSVVARDSVRIAFLVAALNDLDIFSCDIQNAYLTAPCRENVYTIAGTEFGSDKGKILLITRALYGLKSAGASFRAFLAEHLHGMGYRSSLADPDVWIRPAVKPNGEEYYEYVLAYVDDILCISHEPGKTMEEIKSKFKLKNDAYGPPTEYLGATIGVMENEHGTKCWTQSADKYLEASIKTLEESLAALGRKLPTKECHTPFNSGYRPELDCTREL